MPVHYVITGMFESQLTDIFSPVVQGIPASKLQIVATGPNLHLNVGVGSW